MNMLIQIKTNDPPCLHTVVTVTEDGETREITFHDSDFEDDKSIPKEERYVPDAEWKEIYKMIKNTLIVAGSVKNPKKLSKSKDLFDGFTLTQSFTKEVSEL